MPEEVGVMPRAAGLRVRDRAACLFVALGLQACALERPAVGRPPPAALGVARLAAPVPSGSGGLITHVIFIIQENRSFDDLFQGYPGADTQSWGLNSHEKHVKLKPISLAAPYDIDHTSTAFFEAFDDGKLDGWDKESTGANKSQYPTPQYGYVPHSESQLYFEMAAQYVLADRMNASHIDASYVSHQYAIAAQANRAVDYPSGAWGCSQETDTVVTLRNDRSYGPAEPVCQNYETLGDELDGAGISWRYYAYSKESDWLPYRSIRHILHGPDWKTDVIGSSSRVIQDIRSGALADVSWVTPTGENSDHGGSLSTTGPHWVASVVNAVGESPYWNSSAIFVMWDEWGGWYDHVRPQRLDYDGLGFRVPLLIISPYAKSGYVTHVQYEHGSILRFIEDNWGLGQLAASDARANDPATDAFDFAQPPRTFKRFTSVPTADDFIRIERTQQQSAPDTQ